ncbi:hypothetical protein [Bacillus thuringiensis]|uniref:Uncharacterized protein n=1 Tax=Bacillus thuringiensis TaxID=1428 RepID=A0A9X6TI87_BACTU|nr:hypothetical protein [Bacillus thuringiensis]PEA86649.1 hypothetical protein CON71_28815 [Bacillus thuringiensis]
MGCKGQLLTEEQVDRLQFMIHNHYKKNMDICSCDVERVLALNRTSYQPGHVQDEPLLVIEVKDMNSVPSVIYKGIDIKGKVSVDYEWTTNDLEQVGAHNLKIKHIDDQGKNIIGKTIQEERLQ